MKVCRECGASKPLEEYHTSRNGKGGKVYRKNICKVCQNEYARSKYHNLSEEVKKERRRKNPCNTPEWHKEYKLRTQFGLTTEEYRGMITIQNNRCITCGTEFDEQIKPQVDHCHNTGKVRGLLCRPCNTSLGLLKENPETLKNLITYLHDNL
jgi:hypothetical protein